MKRLTTDPGRMSILKEYGFSASDSVETLLIKFQNLISNSKTTVVTFETVFGIFMGYPPKDVIAFARRIRPGTVMPPHQRAYWVNPNVYSYEEREFSYATSTPEGGEESQRLMKQGTAAFEKFQTGFPEGTSVREKINQWDKKSGATCNLGEWVRKFIGKGQ